MAEHAGSPAARRRSALAGLVEPLPGGAECGLRLVERPHGAKINLRGDRGDAAFRAAVTAAIGAEPPPGPEAWIGREGTAILGLGPDEWLIVGPPEVEARLEAGLRTALAGQFAAVTDVTENWTVIEARGIAVRAVLAKGCPLDLHPRHVRPGFVGQSLLAQTDIILHLMGESPGGDPGGDADSEAAVADTPAAPETMTVHLYVRRSFAAHLWHWLADAGLEFGVGPG